MDVLLVPGVVVPADTGRTCFRWGLGLEPAALEQQLRDHADAYVEMGFTQFTLGYNGPDWNVETAQDWLDWRDEMNASR